MRKRYMKMSLAGALASRTGDDMSGIAILLFAYGGSAHSGATVFGLLAVAAALGGPLLGVWLDRARSSVPLALSLAAFTVGLSTLGLALHHRSDGLAMLLALVTGLFGPAVAGGWSAVLSDPDPARGRRLAIFDASSYSVAGLLGPALAGAAYAIAGPVAPLAVTLALLATGAACAPFAQVAVQEPRAGRQPRPLTDLAEGLAAIVRRPRLRAATAASCTAFFGFGLFSVAVPRIGQERFGSPAAGSVLLAVLAAAALASNAWLARRGGLRRSTRVLVLATLLVGVGLAVAVVDSPVAAVAAAVVIGAGDGPQLASLIHIRHREAPARLRTQVFTTGASLKITASGAGALTAAPLMSHGLGAILLLAAAAHLVAALVASSTLRLSRRSRTPGGRPRPGRRAPRRAARRPR